MGVVAQVSLIERVRDRSRVKYYSVRTGQAYRGWMHWPMAAIERNALWPEVAVM
jgi:hypothetical protein